MLKDFVSLIFPVVCAGCGNSLYKNEESICTECIYHLPLTNYHLSISNPVVSIFWGRLPIHSAAAYLHFDKGSIVQQFLHELKYNNHKEIGLLLGKMYGHELKISNLFDGIDLIVPVPLHARKLKQRGYNQSELFAKGLSAAMNIPVANNLLFRTKKTETQTQKNRFQRWQNVENKFEIKESSTSYPKHILLVDDVITTGATLEACAQTLLKIPNIKVSIATIAYAGYR